MMAISRIDLTEFTNEIIANVRMPSATTINTDNTTTMQRKLTNYYTRAQVIHYAVCKLAKEVLPSYEADDGELTPKQLAAIRKAIPQGRAKSVKSSLF